MASEPPAAGVPFGFGPRQFGRWILGVTAGPGAIMYRAMLLLALIGTGKGLITFFLAGKALELPLLIAYGTLIGLFACAFIGVMAYSIERVFDRERPVDGFRELLVRLGWVGLYAVSFFISLSFSFAFWWDLLLADSATNNETRGRLEIVTRQLNDLTGRIALARTEAERIATRSRQLSETESSTGNTCDKGSGRTFGPIAAQRRSDADAAAGLAASITGSNETVTDQVVPLVNGARTALANGGEANLQTAQDNLRQAVDRINLAAEQVRGRAGEFTLLADKYRDREGAPAVCSHEATRLSFAGIATQLNGLTTIPPASLQVYSGERSVVEAVSRLWTPLGLTRLLPGTREAPMTSGDFLPLVISLIVDLSLFFLGLERGDRRSPGSRAQLRAEERARLSRAIEHMLGGYLHKVQIQFGGATYFVVPEVADGEPDGGYSRLVMLDFLRSFDRYYTPVIPFSLFSLLPLRWLMDEVAGRRIDRTSGTASADGTQDGLLAAWRKGSKFRWFRLNRKYADQFLAHIGEFAEPENADPDGPIDPGGRRSLFLGRELPQRLRRARAREAAEAARDAQLEQDILIDRATAAAVQASLGQTEEQRARLSQAEQRLVRARLEARIAEAQRQASDFEARARRARHGTRSAEPFAADPASSGPDASEPQAPDPAAEAAAEQAATEQTAEEPAAEAPFDPPASPAEPIEEPPAEPPAAASEEQPLDPPADPPAEPPAAPEGDPAAVNPDTLAAPPPAQPDLPRRPGPPEPE